MTDPMGKHWRQPDHDLILVDDLYAVMSRDTMNQLYDYSHSVPTGVYVGKMWRCRASYEDGSEVHFLCWFGPSEKPDSCLQHVRKILLLSEL